MSEVPFIMLPPKFDFVFKRLFGDPRDVEFLILFLRAALGLSPEEFADIVVLDPLLNRAYPEDKECVPDVRVKLRSGRVINIEIQVCAVPGMFDRMQFYAARLVSEQVKKGEEYAGMPQVVCIAILDHRLIRRDERYHHRFRLHDPEAGMEYPNSQEIHTLELPKLPATSDGPELWDWMRFLSSETPEEFEALKERRPDMAGVVARLAELSADEEMRMLAEARDKAEHDRAARERHIEKQSRAEGRMEGRTEGEAKAQVEIARRMLQSKMPLSDIVALTGLPIADIERLSGKCNR